MVGYGELIVILCIILVLFGGKKLPEFAQSLGKGIREFKKALYGNEEVSEKVLPSKEDNKIDDKK